MPAATWHQSFATIRKRTITGSKVAMPPHIDHRPVRRANSGGRLPVRRASSLTTMSRRWVGTRTTNQISAASQNSPCPHPSHGKPCSGQGRLAAIPYPPITTSRIPGRVNTQSASATVRCAKAMVARSPVRSARIFHNAAVMMLPTKSTAPKMCRNFSVVYTQAGRLEQRAEALGRPVDHDRLPHDVAHRHEPECPAVLAVASIIPEHKDVARRHRLRSVITAGGGAQIGLPEGPAVDVDRAVADLDALAGDGHHALDVVPRGVGRRMQDDDLPGPGRPETVDELVQI